MEDNPPPLNNNFFCKKNNIFLEKKTIKNINYNIREKA